MSQLYVKSLVQNHMLSNRKSQLLLCVNGEAGTGKSHLLKEIKAEIVKIHGQSSVLIVAPTGVAALNIDGLTIHTAFRIPIHEYDAMQRIRSACFLVPSYFKLKYLIIDEMSMISEKLFKEIDKRMQILMQCKLPFGGISVLLFGDLLQLKPVNGEWIFTSNLWPIFRHVTLSKNYRMTSNTEYAQLCHFQRIGQLRAEHIKMLEGRCRTNMSQVESQEFKDCVHLFSTKKDVDAFNANYLKNLPEAKHVFNCTDVQLHRSENFGWVPRIVKYEREVAGLPTRITLAIGAKVMLCKNANIRLGLVNGRTGTVTNLFPVKVRFDAISDYPETIAEIRQYEGTEETDNVTISRRQYPLLNGPGHTIHKVQGLTLNKIVIDFKNLFCSSLAFVALSRVRRITDIIVDNFQEKTMFQNTPDSLALRETEILVNRSENFPQYIVYNSCLTHRTKKILYKL